MFISGSPPRGASGRRVDRGPRPPRLLGDVDRQVVAPVPVDLRDRDPAPVEEPRLHRVLGVVPVDDRHRGTRVGDPPVRRAELGRRAERATRHPRQVHAPWPSTGRRGSRPGGRGSGRTSCRTGTCARRRSPRRTRRSGATPAAGAGRNDMRASVAGSYVASHVRTGTQPSPSGGRGSAVLAISAQKTASRPSATSPPSGQNQRLRICSPVPGLERHRRRGGPAVEQREAAAGLHHRRVVGERRLVERRRVARCDR